MSEEKDKHEQYTPEEFLLNIPLYTRITLPDEDTQIKLLSELALFDKSLDAYCIECKQTSVFQNPHQTESVYPNKEQQFKSVSYKPIITQQAFSLSLVCSRMKHHKMLFSFFFKGSVLIKIGQYPSIADLNSPEIDRYRKDLSQENYANLHRAIVLKSHGIGAGSLIYLRRIFENLIEDAHLKAINETTWNEDEYKRSRMDEKIQLLKEHLPSILMELRGIYSIMSKGIHSLTEEECRSYFEPVRVGIELILEEKITELQQAEKQRKAQEAKQILSAIKGKLSS